ncbi:hypothetical protein KP77_11990 [Jeotgalibacillus alimentarius]|uniref:Uncharacterized protein YyaB-like PH domain-containing protein n=1 Tax=Jeotgalibacillus alimentarius TaxID=135826 RepID=A0A0C2VRY3_9BACL|nr:PH domain-containing protein [Jeotgalibacillus alimentarius]KIL51687.1 hypothetical protein KP77_11990 [Jeotgalibacillus alimentarius]
MTFRSKIDQSYKVLMLIAVVITGIATMFPIFIDDQIDLIGVIVLTSIFAGTVCFLLWTLFSIKYIFFEDDLLVKGGPFRSRIRYEDITRVAHTHDLMTGYRLTMSSDSIQIFYRTGTFGSVKVSPEALDDFVEEIRKRCPNVRIDM